MVMHGLETTVPVTLDMMILQGHAVMRGSRRSLVVVDMPFGSYEASKEQAFMNAARVLKETGCGAIKVEGGKRIAETIAFLVERGVPVMAHVGLTPQAINVLGSFRAQGREEADWARIEQDAIAVAQAGAFSVVIEAVAEPLARKLTAAVRIPTIGIGASMSSNTSICPSQATLAPMPMVGIRTAAVSLRASGSATASITTAKAPASATAIASCSMRAQPASSRPCARNEPSTLIACGVRPTCAITGTPRSTRKPMVSAMRVPPSTLMAPQPVSFSTRAALMKACSLEAS